ncbi:vitamin K epoxide reductase family protein [Calothrix sp. UHCC 0171]|uniref:vitamin K epoxide reductase family protein n=1 Tax=Calothrix sp. UHCC 0171 TaxID=3110245 RepID=UPI002B20C7E8|nr:vitamin K epoxide reductase family protein [Calothrix sp. UHCC 0171]MEA5570027.1 vitamin K epoxide reductase family protein [Calothrix sp. UHCC 0171]
MIRRRSTPWIHRYSRIIIAAIAGIGALTTAYLTYEKLSGGAVACVAETAGKAGCNDVLSSPWAEIPVGSGIPLPIYGFLAYLSMLIFALSPLAIKPEENKEQRKKIENVTWLLLLVGAFAMTVFSAYLMYVMAFRIQALCPYCIASATFSLSFLVLTIIGRSWEDLGQIFFTGIIVGMVTLIATLGVYGGIGKGAKLQIGQISPEAVRIVESGGGQGGKLLFDASPGKVGEPSPEFGWEVTTTSGEAEIQLAQHLVKVGAKQYSAFWCPHCHEQKLLFGKEAQKILDDNNAKVECAAQSPKGKPQDCQAAGIKGFPTWIINGKQYSGVQNLDELAKVTGYTGIRNFKYFR